MPFQVWSVNHPRGNFWELCNADSGGPAQIYSIQNRGQSLHALHLEKPAPAPVASQRQHCPVTEVGFGKLPELTMPPPQRGLKTPRSSASRGQLHGQGTAGGGSQAAVWSSSQGPAGQPRAPTQRSTHPKERLQGPGIRSSNPCPWGVNFIRLSRLPHLPGFFCSVL